MTANTLVYEISAVALDVPFGNRFSVETRFDVAGKEVRIWSAEPLCSHCRPATSAVNTVSFSQRACRDELVQKASC